jgi:hypothetical protein
MITQYAKSPRFGTRPAPEGYSADLPPITEADALADPAPLSFERPAPRLATIQCVVCGVEARIPILSSGKLCDLCRADLPLAESNVRADYEAALAAHDRALVDLEQAEACAADEELARFQRALEARTADAPQWELRWAKTIQNGGGLGALLATHDTRLAAGQALTQALVRTRIALGEIEQAKKGN